MASVTATQPQSENSGCVVEFCRAGSLRFCYILQSKYHLVVHFVELIKEGSTGIDSVEAFALEEIKRRKKNREWTGREKNCHQIPLTLYTACVMNQVCPDPLLMRRNPWCQTFSLHGDIETHTHTHTAQAYKGCPHLLI